jgi:hypothetical protein
MSESQAEMFDFSHGDIDNKVKNENNTMLSADEIRQMMFVSGETVEPSPETTMLVEQIVQQQVMEMVSISTCPSFFMRLMPHSVARLHRIGYATWQP